MWMLGPQNRGDFRILPPKMDGENNGSKPYEQRDDFGGIIIFGNTSFFGI